VVLAPEGRRILRLEARNSAVPIERKPPWIKTRLRTGPAYLELKDLVRGEGLHTVCEEAGCPNIFECWEDREATFLIGGDQCTRRCDFCQIDTGKPAPLDVDEPRRVAESVATMGLRPGFRYERSLDVIRAARAVGLVTKSNLILGMGEERHEISEAMTDLRAAGCDLLTITQYLRPSPRHHPVERWVKPEEFVELRDEAMGMGFAGVMSGPLVRSSYRAGRLYAQAVFSRGVTGGSSPGGDRARGKTQTP
jgi:lipoate synthase